jgi:hypothetical protein
MFISYMFQQMYCQRKHALQYILQCRTHCVPNNIMTCLTMIRKLHILVFPQVCTLLKTFPIKCLVSYNIIFWTLYKLCIFFMQRVICKDRKSKVMPLQVMKPYLGCIDTVPLFLNLNIRWKWMASFTFQLVYYQKNIPLHALNDKFGEDQRWSGCLG